MGPPSKGHPAETTPTTIRGQPGRSCKARVDSVAQLSESGILEAGATPTETSNSRYRRRKHYRLGKQGVIDGKFIDGKGNPQHGIGQTLEELEAGGHAGYDFANIGGAMKCGGSSYLEKHQQQYEVMYYEPLLRTCYRAGRSVLPSDIRADMAACPEDYLAFQKDMATSDEEEADPKEPNKITREVITWSSRIRESLTHT
jgi:hypothetical protein